jgi:glycosyltransferase involved in cell wall biosynthesis
MTLVKKRISFVITSLSIGGAEIMLIRLLRSFNKDPYDFQVITLKSGGALEKEVKDLGIPLRSVEMNSARDFFPGVIRLLRILFNTHSDLVFCWMYHANLVGGIAAKITGIPVLWSVRHDFLDPKLLKQRTIWIAKSGASFSNWVPEKIIFCSESSMKEHLKIGYNAKKSQVIPNGFDTKFFKPNSELCARFRHKLGIPSNALVVGHAGRFNPTKDHLSLVKAAGLISNEINRVYYIFCGQDVNEINEVLVNWLKEAGIEKQTRLIGERDDMLNVYSSFDVFVSSSVSESFPNVIGEAMSCAVPCVVTNVGDSALMVGDTGFIVPPSDPSALAEATIRLLKNVDLRTEMGKKARIRIINNYSIEQITRDYEELLL